MADYLVLRPIVFAKAICRKIFYQAVAISKDLVIRIVVNHTGINDINSYLVLFFGDGLALEILAAHLKASH